MLEVVEVGAPGWLDLAEHVCWLVPWFLLLLGAFLYPWPHGARAGVLTVGVSLLFGYQVCNLISYLGLFGPFAYASEEEIPTWIEILAVSVWLVAGMGGKAVTALGAWLVSRRLAETWGKAPRRKGGAA